MEKGGGGASRGITSPFRQNAQVEKWLDYTFGKAIDEKQKVVSVKAVRLLET